MSFFKSKIGHRTAFILAMLFAIGAYMAASSAFNTYFKLTPVVAAKEKIQRGHVIADGDLSVIQTPKSRLPAGAFTDKNQCVGLAAVGLIPAGETLTRDILSPASAAGAASVLAKEYPGLVGYVVPLGINTTVGGLAETGDRVELSTLIKGNGTSGSSAQVVAKSAVVLSVSPQNAGANTGSVVYGLTPEESSQAKNNEAAGATFKAVLLPVAR